jgi:hypothetical protein
MLNSAERSSAAARILKSVDPALACPPDIRQGVLCFQPGVRDAYKANIDARRDDQRQASAGSFQSWNSSVGYFRWPEKEYLKGWEILCETHQTGDLKERDSAVVAIYGKVISFHLESRQRSPIALLSRNVLNSSIINGTIFFSRVARPGKIWASA